MNKSGFFFDLAEQRFLEPPPEKKPADYCRRCGRALQAWEFTLCGALYSQGWALCGDCAKKISTLERDAEKDAEVFK
jgi:hypothetical protein